MKQVAIAVLALLVLTSVASAQTDTPTETPTSTPTNTPTVTPMLSSELLAIVVSDGTQEGCFQYSGSFQQLDVRNIGTNSATLKLGRGITETTPATPTATAGEYILPAAVSVRLPYGKKFFCYRTAGSAVTSLSIAVVPQSERP